MNQESTKPKVTFWSPSGLYPVRATTDSIGFDLVASEDTFIENGDYRRVHTDLYLEMDPGCGFYARVVSRSSLFTRFGLLCIEGTIDPGYRGEIQVQVYKPDRYDVMINTGEAIAQLVFMPYIIPEIAHEWGTPPITTVRGLNGWGSTDKEKYSG